MLMLVQLCSNAQPEPTYPVLATDDEKKWKAIHSGFAPAFSEEAVVQYLPQLVQEVGADWSGFR